MQFQIGRANLKVAVSHLFLSYECYEAYPKSHFAINFENDFVNAIFAFTVENVKWGIKTKGCLCIFIK